MLENCSILCLLRSDFEGDASAQSPWHSVAHLGTIDLPSGKDFYKGKPKSPAADA